MNRAAESDCRSFIDHKAGLASSTLAVLPRVGFAKEVDAGEADLCSEPKTGTGYPGLVTWQCRHVMLSQHDCHLG